MDFLQLSGIGKAENGNAVISDVNFEVKKHQRVALAGETGSGKSTLLKIIAGFAQPDLGEVRFKGERVEGPAEKLIPGHPGVAYLSQQYELPNNMWVAEVLEYADDLPPGEAALLYQTCRIDHLLKRRTNQLSGGERQRIALARLLTRMPEFLLLDEPFSNLDPIHKQILKKVIEDIGHNLGTTCMLASHDPLDTLSWADAIIVIRAGRIIQQAAPHLIYHQPVDAYVAGLFGGYNLVPAHLAQPFYQYKGVKKDRDIFFRPDAICIADKSASTIGATVVNVSFMGAWDEIELLAGEVRLVYKAINHGLGKGDAVNLCFDTGKFWYW